MTVIERAEQRMEEEERNNGCVSYWSAYLDGARRQKKEDELKVVDAVPKWIPCNERLPDSYGKYIVTSGNSVSVVVHVLCYGEAMSDNPCWFFYDSEYGYVTVDDVIAWMPLPEPYKGKEQDDALDS